MRAYRVVAVVALVGLLALVAVLVWRATVRGSSDAPPKGAHPAGLEEGDAKVAPRLASPVAGPKPSPAPAALPQGPFVTGRVVDATGAAVAGAQVVASSDANATTFALGDAGSSGSPATRATSDAAGRFAITVQDDAPFHYLTATAEGHGIAVLPRVAPRSDVVLVLPLATALVGTITDPQGKPVVGATVHVRMLFDALRVERQATSGSGGVYRVADVPPTADPPERPAPLVVAFVDVVAEGFAPMSRYAPAFPRGQPETRLDLVLSRGILVHGRVVDADSGAPIEGATVDVQETEAWQPQPWQRDAALSSPYGPQLLARRTTGADGAFRFEHVPGTLSHDNLPSVVAWRTGFALALARVNRVDGEGTSKELVFRLRRSGAVSGRVIDAEGRPVAGATVVSRVAGYEVGDSLPPPLLPAEAPRASGKTGADGRFLLTAVPGRVGEAVVAEIETYRPIPDGAVPGMNDRQAAEVEARVEVGRTTDVGDLRLPPIVMGPTVRLRVFDREGRPVWGAEVFVSWSDVARTDRAGEASWSHVAEGDGTVRATGFAPATFMVPEAGTGTEPIEVRLERGSRVRGRVLRADGTPAARAKVSVALGSRPIAEMFPDPLSGGGEPPRPLAEADANADGTFEFVDLVAGPWHLRATLRKRVGLDLPWNDLRALRADVPSNATDIELVLPADDSPATGRIEGRVVGTTEGDALPGIVVRLLHGEETVDVATRYDHEEPGELSPDTFLIPPDGRFAFDLAPVGTLSLEVEARGWLKHRVEGIGVREGVTTSLPTIVMQRGVILRGTVRAPGVTSFLGRELEFRLGDSGSRAKFPVAEDGTYRATGLVPGTYHVEMRGGGVERRDPPLLSRGARTYVIPDVSGEVPLDIDLVLAGMITLRPSDPRLPPPPYGSDRPTEEQKQFGAATRVRLTAADGTVILDHKGAYQGGLLDGFGSIGGGTFTLFPGRYVARIDYPTGESHDEPIALEPGPTVFVAFRGP